MLLPINLTCTDTSRPDHAAHEYTVHLTIRIIPATLGT